MNELQKANATLKIWVDNSGPRFSRHVAHTDVLEKRFVICTLTFDLYRNEQFTIKKKSLTCYLQRLQFHSIEPAALGCIEASDAAWLLPDVKEKEIIKTKMKKN